MRLRASVFYSLHRPSPCDLRLYLRSKGVEEGKPSPYEEVIIELGQWYEKKHLASFGDLVDLSEGDEDRRVQQTVEQVSGGASVLYQPTFRTKADFGGTPCVVVGQPDFLIRDGKEYLVRDVKLSRRINERDHPEILLQMGLYGWLYEQTFQVRPKKLEVLAGTGVLVEVPFEWIGKAFAEVERVLALQMSQAEPFSPVGWTKCGSCTFRERCWVSALDRKDVATIPDVDQSLTRALREVGISSIGELLGKFDEVSLAEFQRPRGNRKQRVGKAAHSILRAARVLESGKEERIQVPQIPKSQNYAMFDLEGLPPQLENLEKIYLWGIQVFGATPSEYLPGLVGFGPDGDKEGWAAFLQNVARIFKTYGDIPFVHWHHYERTHLNMYIERYGDRDGIAARVKTNLFDLLPATED